jgi:hypothetical protein
MSFTLGSLVAPVPFLSLFELATPRALNFWLFGWPLSSRSCLLRRTVKASVYCSPRPASSVCGHQRAQHQRGRAVHYAELIGPIVPPASGVEELAQWVRARLDASAGRILALPIAATLCAFVLYLPLYVGSLSAMGSVARAPYDLVQSASLDRAVVFVRSLGALDFPPGSWAYVPRNPSPALDDRVLYVRDLGEERNR